MLLLGLGYEMCKMNLLVNISQYKKMLKITTVMERVLHKKLRGLT